MNRFTVLAKSICQTLVDQGFIAYFAGGWVRDLLLGIDSCEVDIATNAPPETIQKIFPKTIAVGINFGVIVVVLENAQFEVATFRHDRDSLDGRHPKGVDFSTPLIDAQRRDFTINGMFYDPLKETLIDYVEGQKDLKNKLIRAIGDPQKRFHEDRLRMLRAVRFAAHLNFVIEPQTERAIAETAPFLLPSVSMERIFQEFSKMAKPSSFTRAMSLMKRFGLLKTLFPQYTLAKDPAILLPQKCPTIIYIFTLFEKLSLEEALALCDYLKTTNRDKKLIQFFVESQAINQDSDLATWAHFYAHPDAPLFLSIYGKEEIQVHQKRQEKLRFFIERLQKKQPLITAAHLKEEGIEPGKKMGLLLAEGEKLAINHNIRNTSDLVEQLKKTSIWLQ